jgi:pyruvate formate lyase activating enzyme
LDFISLDYKAPSYKYQEITKHKNFALFEESLIHFIENGANFEVRTTVHIDLLDENDINHIIKDLHDKGYKNSYYIQNYMHQEKILGTLKEQDKKLDTSKIITNLIDVKFRNF